MPQYEMQTLEFVRPQALRPSKAEIDPLLVASLVYAVVAIFIWNTFLRK